MNVKSTLIFLGFIIAMQMAFSQIANGFNYQAVLRDANGSLMKNQNVNIRVNLRYFSASGNIEYSEIHDTVTDGYGAVNLIIGTGTKISAKSFDDLTWSDSEWYIEIILNGQSIGVSQIASVPFSFKATKMGLQDLTSLVNVDYPMQVGTLSAFEIYTYGNIKSINGAFILDAITQAGTATSVSIESQSTTGSGIVQLRAGPGNSSSNVILSYPLVNSSNGYVGVCNASGAVLAGAYVSNAGVGIIFGDQKNFRMDHPTDPTKEIWYCSIEGPEAAAYARGTAQLVNGRAEVLFDEHFELVANASTMTIVLTPLSGQSKGLACVHKTETGFEVEELFSGGGNYEFDWEVKAVRKGYEDYEAIRDKDSIPQPAISSRGNN